MCLYSVYNRAVRNFSISPSIFVYEDFSAGHKDEILFKILQQNSANRNSD